MFLVFSVNHVIHVCVMFLGFWQIGKTKVFLRAGQMAELDARRAEVLGNAARKMQRRIRTYIARKDFVALRDSAIQLQALCRCMLLYSWEILASCEFVASF